MPMEGSSLEAFQSRAAFREFVWTVFFYRLNWDYKPALQVGMQPPTAYHMGEWI